MLQTYNMSLTKINTILKVIYSDNTASILLFIKIFNRCRDHCSPMNDIENTLQTSVCQLLIVAIMRTSTLHQL